MKHKKHHWIPQSYLKAWCDLNAPSDHDPYVWRFSKDGETVQKKAPKNIFYEKDLYTIDLADGTRDLTVEHGLAGLEDQFVRIREHKLANRLQLTPEEGLLLRAFVAAMQARTRAHLAHWQSQWKGALEMMDRVQEAMRVKTPDKREQLAHVMPPVGSSERSLSYEDVNELAEGPVGPIVVSMVQTQLPILARMTLTIFGTEDALGFITSDSPCVWFDPEAYKRPALLDGPGLAFPTIEVTLPVSPEQMVLLSWHPLQAYIDINNAILDELNRRTRSHCDEYFVTRRPEKRKIWFNPGFQPGGQ